jgi:hypothetical protein
MYNIRLFGIVTMNLPPTLYKEYILIKGGKKKSNLKRE